MPGLSPSCKIPLLTLPVESFLLHARECLDIKRRASLRFRNVLGTRALVRPEERVEADPVAVLYNCLKKSRRDGRTKLCCGCHRHCSKWQWSWIAAWEVEHEKEWCSLEGDAAGEQVSQQVNRSLPYVHGVAEWSHMWPDVVEVAVLIGGQTGGHQGPDTILRILRAWASSLLFAI